MPDKPGNEDGPGEAAREQSPWALAGLGLQFFAALILFVYAGNWLDARFHTSPLLLLVGVFVGGGASFYSSYRRLMRSVEAAESARRRLPKQNNQP